MMNTLRVPMVFLTLLMLLIGTALGQVHKGLGEANVTGNFAREVRSTDSGSSSCDIFQLDLSVGYFVTDKLEIGQEVSLLGSSGYFIGDVSGFLSYHFPKSTDARNVPYVGGKFGIGFGDYNDIPILWGGYAGVKIFVAGGGGAVLVQAFFSRQHFDTLTISQFGLENGISIFF
jgi:hypothetical protein